MTPDLEEPAQQGAGDTPRRRLRWTVGRYIGARLVQGLLVVFGAIVISFFLVNLSGNPSGVILGALATPEQREEVIRELGYDRPFFTRLVDYVGDAARGDLGSSYRDGRSAVSLVLDALPNTLLLVACALGVAILVAIPVAVFSVLRREQLSDRVLRRVILIVGALPDFWVALVLVLVFAVSLRVLPVAGFDGARSLILPATALAVPLLPALVRLLRGALLDTAGKDFVVGLRAKGFSDDYIMWHQGLRNSMVPFVTWIGLQLGQLIGGTLIIEIVFSWPGIGFLLSSAVQTRDLAIIQAIVVVVAVAYVIVNLCADLLVLAIDPRTRTTLRF